MMKQTYRATAIVGFVALLAGLNSAADAQLSPQPLAVSVDGEAQAEPTASAVEFYNQGVDKLEAGDYEGAVTDFQQALQLNPEDADTHYNLGYAHLNLGSYEQAIEAYTAAIRLNPQFAQAYSNRAYAHYFLQNYAKTITDSTRALERDPDPQTAYVTYIRRGNAYDELANHEAAIEDYSSAIALDGDRALAFYHRGLAHNQLENHQAAVEDYTETIRIEPTFAEAFYSRGITYLNLESREDALADLQQAADLFKAQGRTENYQNAIDAIQAIQQQG
jgi:tetratricopeptide (TPR) repeat protein